MVGKEAVCSEKLCSCCSGNSAAQMANSLFLIPTFFVLAQNTPTGVRFKMEESTISLLDVYADADDNSIKVQIRNNKGNRVKVVNGKTQLLPLLDVVVDNLIDSITAEVGSQLVEDFHKDLDDDDVDDNENIDDHSEPVIRGSDHAPRTSTTTHLKETKGEIVDESSFLPYRRRQGNNMDQGDANVAHQETNKKHPQQDYERGHFNPTRDLPTQEDINKLWKETERTPEDDEMMRKFIAGELPQQDITIDLDAICEQAEKEEQAAQVTTQKTASMILAPTEREDRGQADAVATETAHIAAPPKVKNPDPNTAVSNVLYRSATAKEATVVSVMQRWCQQYTSRGIGITTSNTAEGAVLTFPFDGAPALHLTVRPGTQGSLTVQSVMVHSTSETIVLEKDSQELVNKAVKAIESGLTKELESTLLTSDAGATDSTPNTQRKVFAIPMDPKLEVDEALAAVAAVSSRIEKVDFTPYNSPGSYEDESEEEQENDSGSITGAHAASAKIPIYPREPLPPLPPRTSSKPSRPARSPLPSVPPLKRRDPALMQKAAQVGVRLEKYENAGIEEQAIKELNALLQSSRTKGFLSVIKAHQQDNAQSSANTAETIAAGLEGRQKTGAAARDHASAGITTSETFASPELAELFQAGQRMSSLTLQDILNRPTHSESADTLRGPTPKVPVNLPGSSLVAGDSIDIFQSPAELVETLSGRAAPLVTPLHPTSMLGKKEIAENYDTNRPPDRTQYDLDNLRLETLITTLNETAPELHDLVIDGHRDLLLSENILFLLKRAQASTDSMKVRLLYKKIAERASSLVMELGMLFKVESARHLHTIQEVCRITTEYQHDEMQYLDQLEAIKPFFDKEFLSYLTYAIGEEMSKMRKNGVDPTLAPSEWLQVLSIVRRGVEAEFISRYDHLIESILLVLRWDRPGDDEIRSEIFQRFVSITPAMELPYLKELSVNMVENILQRHAVETGLVPKEPMFSSAASEHPMDPAELEELVVQMKNLQKDVELHLSDAYITEKLAEWEEEARQAGTPVYVRHRNAVRQNDLETAHYLTQQAKNDAFMNDHGSSEGFGGLLGDGKL